MKSRDVRKRVLLLNRDEGREQEEMRFLNCCRIKRSDTMKKNSLKTSRTSVKEFKADAERYTIARNLSMNTG